MGIDSSYQLGCLLQDRRLVVSIVTLLEVGEREEGVVAYSLGY